jgi:hypothetical protein
MTEPGAATPRRLLPTGAALEPFLGARSRVQLLWFVRAAADRTPAEVLAAVTAAGARLVWSGRTESLLIGPDPVYWTHAALAEISSEALRTAAASAGSAEGVEAAALWIVEPQSIPAPVRAIFRCLRPLGRLLERDPVESLRHRPQAMDDSDINPSQERLAALAADRRDGRTTMINLLHFRDRADDGGTTRGSGRAAYRRYGMVAARSVAMVGGSMDHLGRLRGPLLDVGGLATTGPWHDLAIVHYPAPSSIVKLEAMPGYAKAVHHRTAGLARTAIVVAR